ncbi:MAG TPA: PhzF family phenazine biosynthesis protein [Terriglobia bacterium]|jgi:trans-2,3-dihydro-3-hydroxyanthranilate isomerase|nr:PhzF family phenazine biosynthesis protein [Terriglobia bacterium]
MSGHRYRVVDVFTSRPLEGNPLAVFPDGAAFDDAAMQSIARELNLSETVFVLPATRLDCDVRVRIFTPRFEMAFAGHPTVGAAFVLLDEGIVPGNSTRFTLEEKIGPVPIRVEAGARPMIWLRTPPIRPGPAFDGAACARVVGLGPEDLLDVTPQIFSAGNPNVFIAVRDKAAVDRATVPDLRELTALKAGFQESLCVFVFTPTPEGAYSRMFAPEHGVFEDPATGSATGPLAAFMIQHGLVPGAAGTRFVSEQGTKMGRRSLLHVEVAGDHGADGIDVGGNVTPVIEGTLRI